jgi:HPt (histidine-containing phosphotransfer) domain-containing protein
MDFNSGNAASSSPEPSNSSIDVALFLDRCMDDAALALMVLGSFRDKALADLEEIAKCVSQADADAVSRRTHAMKGSAGAIAAGPLMEAAARLEEAAHSKAMGSFAGLMAELSSEMHRCMVAMPGVQQTLQAKAGA